MAPAKVKALRRRGESSGVEPTTTIHKGRTRSPFNFLVNLMAGLAAYTYLPKQPSIDIYPKGLPAQPPAVF